MQPDRQALRRNLRQQRRNLSPAAQQHAATQVCQQLLQLPCLNTSQHIALYLANDGEIDTTPLLQALWQQGKSCYLPVLDPVHAGQLQFLRYTPDTPMLTNRFGIAEPQPVQAQPRAPQELDLVLLPLVGFDRHGGRLGMGGGFYDRTFAFAQNAHPAKPLLIGLAHHCQLVERLPLADWDVPLQAVVTDQQVFEHRA